MISFEEIKEQNKKRRGQKYYIALVITILLVLVFFKFFSLSYVSGPSMNPTLYDGNLFVAADIKICQIKKGDIICIDSVILEETIIKRVIGVEGDVINFTKDSVFVNGKKIDEPYITDNPVYDPDYNVTVPKGYVFVMGDNRNISADSREIGCVSVKEIVSKYLFKISD